MEKCEAVFSLDGRDFPDDQPVANSFVFCALMAVKTAKQRGGKASDYITECTGFLTDVVGRKLYIADPLPPEFDWTPMGSIEMADAMLEYDDG